jgi:tetratricopeptide (TPR) repeat protein
LGLCKFKTNNPSEAVAAFSKSIELAPFHGESYFYRGCMYALGEQFSLAMQDFTNAVRLNPNDAPSSGMLGSLLISTGKRTEGCIRLTRSYQLGYAPAMPIIERYCSNGVAEDGSKIVRLPTVTVDADRINYAQRVKNTKQGIAMAQRIRSPFQQHSRNLTQPKGFNAGTLFIPDGNAVAAVPVETPSNLPSSPTSIPLQAIINKADCNSAVINTQSFVSIPCIAYFFAQETKPFDNPDIQKIVKKIQLLSDEIVVLQYAIGNVTPGSYAAPTASGTDALSADFGRLSTMYDTFMTLVAQLQNKLSLHEVVLQKEGKL